MHQSFDLQELMEKKGADTLNDYRPFGLRPPGDLPSLFGRAGAGLPASMPRPALVHPWTSAAFQVLPAPAT